MNKHQLWLPVIIFIAFAMRLTLLGEQSLWYDEGVSWLLTQKSMPDLIQWTAADIQPPLYYLMLWLSTRLFGHSEFALRFPSVIFNVLTLPVLYLLARRLFAANSISLLAATLFALSPLMVYYSQETRMYALLVFETTLASYLLVRLLHHHSPPPYFLLPATYSLIAAAALYTHYFAAFLLAAHALYALIILWQQRWPKTIITRMLYAYGLTLLLFSPWLVTLFSRLGDDPSYWPGALKLNEAARKVIISFTVGETVFEQIGWLLALGYGLIFVLAGMAWFVHKITGKNKDISSRNPQFATCNLLFLLLWLFIPLALILLLSYQSPKFNPRYTLLSYPAFTLLLTLALTQFLKTSTPRIMHYIWHFTFWGSVLFIFTTYAFSLYNWFTVIDFSKTDFKALAQFVRERQASKETVLLSSGHMFPVWAYYYGWDNWTPLPQMERLDVNRVTGPGVARDIAPAVEGKDGVWLVSWQDEVIDPNGVVPFWLDRIGHRPHDAGDFWGLSLEHWQLDPANVALLQENPVAYPVIYNFNNHIDLLGMTQLSDTEIALFWQARQPLPDDLLVTLDLTDDAGFKWNEETAITRPGAYLYPPSRWRVGQLVLTRHSLPWETGSPPGDYRVEVGLSQLDPATGDFMGWDILDEQGRPQRRTALLASLTLNRPVQPGPEFAGMFPPLVDLSPVVKVLQSTLTPPYVEPGEQVLSKLLWQAGTENQTDIVILFQLVTAAGNVIDLGEYAAPSRNFMLSHWQPGEVVLGQYALHIPPDTAPGPATVQLRLINLNTKFDHVFPLGRLDILPGQRNFTPPKSVDIPLNGYFPGSSDEPGTAILLGADCSTWDGSACHASPNQPVTLTLYWQARHPFNKNYTVFTHLLGPDETVLVNADHAPAKPTQGWVSGEIIADTITLTPPANLSPGTYQVEVGLYNAADPAFQRRPLTTGETRVVLPDPLVVP
jgi:4-amino-4-deoxy-L-arabinose transferase-like glycosyltransferase